jgi:hypothetical protein
MKMVIFIISFAVLVGTSARAEVITYDCTDIIIRADTKTRAVTETNPSSGQSAVFLLMQLNNEYLTWQENPPIRISRKTGLMYHLQGESWVPDPDPRPCRQK